MDLITIVSQNMDSVVVITIAITGSIFANIATNKRRSIREAKKSQKRQDVIEGLISDVDMLKQHRETTMLTLVKIETNIKNLDSKHIETQTMITELRSILLNNK
jgi:hypothetical protein